MSRDKIENYNILEYIQDRKRFIEYHNFNGYGYTRKEIENVMIWAKEHPPITNLDKIRQLPNDELYDILRYGLGFSEISGGIVTCSSIDCNECLFNKSNPCRKAREEWLESEAE